MSTAVVTRGTNWNPGRILDLAWDYDPSRQGLADGANVASLTDFGPNGYHAVQATVARQPTIVYDALNGLAGINFVAANAQYLDATFTSIPQPTTIFIVGKTSGTDDYFMDGLDATDRQAVIVSSGGLFTITTAPEALTGPASAGEYVIITAIFNGASSRLRVNGAETIGALSTDALGGIRLGGNQLLAATRHLNGVIVRHIGYSRLLTETEIARVERYLVDLTGVGTDWAVSFPKTRHVYQRAGATTDLALEGTWPVLTEPAPSGIEASNNGGAWTDIGATIVATGTWSGTLTGQTDGQGTLQVRRTDTPADVKSVLLVGVGDVFIVGGQSNAQGHFDNYQTYSHATLAATMFRKTSTTPDELEDPTSSNADRGTVWPLLATHIMADQSVPVCFITAAKGGSGLLSPTDWEPGEDIYTDCVVQVAASRVADAKAILWYQGENDAAGAITGAAYKTALSAMLDAMQMDFGFYLTDTAIASDTFTAADGTTLNGRTPVVGPANWVVRSGALQITGNEVVTTGATPAEPGYVATINMGEENVRLTAELRLSGNDYNGFVFRYDPADGSHYQCRWRAPTGRMQILFWDGATYTTLGEKGVTITAGVNTEVSASMCGPNIKMSVGNSVLRVIEAAENPTMTHHGIRFATAGTGAIDTLAARTITGPPLICAQIGRRTDAAGGASDTDAIRTAQAELPAEDADVYAGPLCHDEDFADEVHWSTNAEAAVLAGRWWRAIDDALYGGTNGTGPTFASAADVDSTHIDVVFTFPGSATSLVLGASPTVGWEVMDSGTERTVSAVALQSATTLRLTLAAAMTGTVTISFGSGNESAGSTILDNGTYPLPPLPFINKAVA